MSEKRLGDFSFRSLLAGSGWLFIAKVCGSVLVFLMMAWVNRVFDPELWGQFSICFSIYVLLLVPSMMGMNLIVVRHLGDTSVAPRALYFAVLRLVLPVAVLIAVLLWLSAPFLATQVFHDAYLTQFIRLTGLAFIPAVFFQLQSEMERGLGRFKAYGLAMHFALPFFSFLFAFSMASNLGRDAVMWSLSFAIVLNAILSGVSMFWGLRSSKSSPAFAAANGQTLAEEGESEQSLLVKRKREKQSNKLAYGALITAGMPLLIASIARIGGMQADTLFLGAYRSEEEVGIYNAAIRLSLFASIVLMAVNGLLAPAIANSWKAGRREELQPLLNRAATLIFWGTLPILVILYAFPQWALLLFDLDSTSAVLALRILLLGQLVSVGCGSVGIFMVMTGKEKVFRKYAVWSFGLNILLLFAMVPSMGMIGAATASSISLAFWNLLSLYYIQRNYGLTTAYLPWSFKPIKAKVI